MLILPLHIVLGTHFHLILEGLSKTCNAPCDNLLQIACWNSVSNVHITHIPLLFMIWFLDLRSLLCKSTCGHASALHSNSASIPPSFHKLFLLITVLILN